MITIILSCIIAVLLWTTYVQYVKNERYEQQLIDSDEQLKAVFAKISLTLHSMRILDEKKMFESDDEVGTVFQQLVDIVNDMRPMLYGVNNEEN